MAVLSSWPPPPASSHYEIFDGARATSNKLPHLEKLPGQGKKISKRKSSSPSSVMFAKIPKPIKFRKLGLRRTEIISYSTNALSNTYFEVLYPIPHALHPGFIFYSGRNIPPKSNKIAGAKS